jgi:hypothetical protein
MAVHRLFRDFVLSVLNSNAVAYPATGVTTVFATFACLWWAFTGNIPFIDRLPIVGPYLAGQAQKIDRVVLQRKVATTPRSTVDTQPTKDAATLPEVLRVDDKLVWFAALAAHDDMFNPNDRLAAAKVNVLIAIDRARERNKVEDGNLVADTESVFESFEALRAPDDPPFSSPRYEWWVKRFEGVNKDEVKKTADELRAYLKSESFVIDDPNAAKRYIRDKKNLLPSVNEAGIRERMCPVSLDPGTFGKYFRFKKDPQEVCPKP